VVPDRLADGRRIAQLLASEIEGHGGALAALRVVDADPDAAPTPGGTFAYAVEGTTPADGANDETADAASAGDERTAADEGDATRSTGALAAVFVEPDRARVEFRRGRTRAAAAARDGGLRVREAAEPPRTLVFVEDGAQVKRALAAFEAVATADGGERGNA